MIARGATIDAGAVRVLASLLEARTGQQITENRRWRVEAALTPLLTALSLERVDQLIARLIEGVDATIADRIVDALLNQETSFFRDAGVIEAAARVIADRDRAGGGAAPARIWCAACASGQEPLSLAMLFAEGGGAMPEIVASDVSAAAISRARAGIYSRFEIQRGLPVRRMVRWFDPAPSGDGHWVARSELLGAISYRRHNLVAAAPPPGNFDLILCRNVLFYLVPARREQVLAQLARALRPGGLLLLGAGETMIGQSDRLRPAARLRGFYEAAAGEPGRAREVDARRW